MKRLAFLLVIMLLVAGACNKDQFPDEFSVIGRWRENITDTDRTEIEFKRFSVLMLKLKGDTLASEYRYKLDKANELQIFDISEFPNGRSTLHRITYNSKDEERITIYGLYPAAQAESVTEFVRR